MTVCIGGNLIISRLLIKINQCFNQTIIYINNLNFDHMLSRDYMHYICDRVERILLVLHQAVSSRHRRFPIAI